MRVACVLTLAANRLAVLLQEVHVPGGRERDRRGEDRVVVHLQPVGGLAPDEWRDLEPARVDDVRHHLIAELWVGVDIVKHSDTRGEVAPGFCRGMKDLSLFLAQKWSEKWVYL